MESDCKSLGPTEVLEVFNANIRTVDAVLGDHTFDKHRHADELDAKVRGLAATQTRRQVGDEAWQRFTGASGRGWRVSPKSTT